MLSLVRARADILFPEPRIRNEIVYLAGDTVTYGELANTLEEVLQRRFERVEWTVPYLLDELAGDPDNMTNEYRAVFAQGRWRVAVVLQASSRPPRRMTSVKAFAQVMWCL